MGSGLVYAIVVLVWVAYLFPSWFNSYEPGSRSVRRYHRAMRVVSKGTESQITRTVAERLEVRAAMRRRRMIVLASLAGVLLISTVMAAFGAVALWVPALPLLVGAIYVTNVRRVVVSEKVTLTRAAAVQRARQQKRSRSDAESLRTMPRTSTALPPVVTASTPSRTVTVVSAEVETWEPIGVPLPTYVTAPKAVRPHRVIDLTRPGQWSEEQKRAEEARLAAVAPSRDEVFDQIAAEEAVALADRLTNEQPRAAGDH